MRQLITSLLFIILSTLRLSASNSNEALEKESFKKQLEEKINEIEEMHVKYKFPDCNFYAQFMGNEGMKRVSERLGHYNFETVLLGYNNVDKEGLQYVFDLIQNSDCATLGLYGNPFEEDEGSRKRILKYIERSSSLTSFNGTVGYTEEERERIQKALKRNRNRIGIKDFLPFNGYFDLRILYGSE